MRSASLCTLVSLCLNPYRAADEGNGREATSCNYLNSPALEELVDKLVCDSQLQALFSEGKKRSTIGAGVFKSLLNECCRKYTGSDDKSKKLLKEWRVFGKSVEKSQINREKLLNYFVREKKFDHFLFTYLVSYLRRENPGEDYEISLRCRCFAGHKADKLLHSFCPLVFTDELFELNCVPTNRPDIAKRGRADPGPESGRSKEACFGRLLDVLSLEISTRTMEGGNTTKSGFYFRYVEPEGEAGLDNVAANGEALRKFWRDRERLGTSQDIFDKVFIDLQNVALDKVESNFMNVAFWMTFLECASFRFYTTTELKTRDCEYVYHGYKYAKKRSSVDNIEDTYVYERYGVLFADLRPCEGGSKKDEDEAGSVANDSHEERARRVPDILRILPVNEMVLRVPETLVEVRDAVDKIKYYGVEPSIHFSLVWREQPPEFLRDRFIGLSGIKDYICLLDVEMPDCQSVKDAAYYYVGFKLIMDRILACFMTESASVPEGQEAKERPLKCIAIRSKESFDKFANVIMSTTSSCLNHKFMDTKELLFSQDEIERSLANYEEIVEAGTVCGDLGLGYCFAIRYGSESNEKGDGTIVFHSKETDYKCLRVRTCKLDRVRLSGMDAKMLEKSPFSTLVVDQCELTKDFVTEMLQCDRANIRKNLCRVEVFTKCSSKSEKQAFRQEFDTWTAIYKYLNESFSRGSGIEMFINGTLIED